MARMRALIALLAALLLDLLAFTLILPLFPSILEHFSKRQPLHPDPIFSCLDHFSRSLQSILAVPSLHRYNNVFFGGIIGSLFSFLQFISSPIFGAFSDQIGRKPLLLFSIFGSLFSYLFWSISGHCFSLFFLSRIVGGLSKASVSLSIAAVTDILPEERRGKGMAFVGTTFSLAFLIGPSIGAYFSLGARTEFDPWPARLAIGLSLAELAILSFWLPETLDKGKHKDHRIHSPPSLWSLISPSALFAFRFVKSPSPNAVSLMRAYSLVYFFFLLLFSALEFTLGFLTHIRFQFSSVQQGRLYLFSGLCMLIIQGFFVRRIPSTPKAQSTGALVGLCSIIPAYLLIAFAHGRSLLYSGLFLYSIEFLPLPSASATVVPFLTTLFTQNCEQSQRGACLGAFRSIGALARAIGPLLGSLFFWLFGPTISYTIGAMGLIFPVLMFRRIRSPEEKKKRIKME